VIPASSPGPTPALALDGITCTFGAKGAGAGSYTAVKDASLSVAAGEFVSVVGPTGCGKSTLLNVAAGLLAPSAGTVRIDGVPLSGINEHAGYMFQADALMPWRNALANVRAGLEFHGTANAEATPRAREWLARVGLAGFEDRFPHQLSGGMRKRVSLAQMLILDPQLLLMDEPFAALDALTRRKMQDELLQLWDDTHFTVLFVTHSIPEAIKIGSRILLLSPHPGQVKAELNSLPREHGDPAQAQALERRIHDMLFADTVENEEEHPHA